MHLNIGKLGLETLPSQPHKGSLPIPRTKEQEGPTNGPESHRNNLNSAFRG